MPTKRITADKELVDMIDEIKLQTMINLNLPLTRANASKILVRRIKNDNKKIIVKKARGKKNGIVIIE